MTELSTDRRFHSLTQEQVQTLDQVLTEVIPIHGRGNFPTLEVKPKDIIHMVRDKLREKEIKVRDVRLNGSTASHVLVKENGTSYKDLDIIFGVELPKQEDFQIIKEVVLRCLLDFLPSGVNKDKITALTMKEAYVQKMVKVFTEHDRWSLISLSNNSGKNVELKFVNSLRRQFEFSVDSFQIILDRMLESYLEAERRQGLRRERPEEKASPQGQSTSQPQVAPAEVPSTSQELDKPQSQDEDLPGSPEVTTGSSDSPCKGVEMREEEPSCLTEEPVTETVDMEEMTEVEEATETSTTAPALEPEAWEEMEQEVKPTEAGGEETASIVEKEEETSKGDFEAPTQDEMSLEALEPAVKIAEPADQVSELTSLVPESMAQEPDNITKFPESTAPVLETAAQAPGPIDPVAEVSCQGPELPELPAPELASQAQTSSTPEPDAQPQESDVQLPQPDVHLLESDFQAPEADIQAQESGIQVAEPDVDELKSDNQVTQPDVHLRESGVQVSEPDVQILETDIQVPEATEVCKKLQEEAASHDEEKEATSPSIDLPSITVVAESMYGDFEQAMDHLRYRLIATRNPEEIRGGGLLKYSNLLVREFKPASETEIKTLERYMCSRFFIDFPDVNEQQRKIESYLRNHFIGEEKSKYDYLMTLRRVVNESTVCLMGHERRQTLNMITVLALKVLGEQNIIPNTTNVTCYYQPAPYMTDHSFNNYYIAHGQPPLFYQPYPLHIHMQTGLV
ncbi:hypothetical protein AGOR_G00077350 [Albula goreensis]|uniref:polynucleotide adenylyltransferase n=1 Tax=Albula goreensis TaxID=1534307 RepID=A0A8T3DN64_9TELE|nr:hypothetical protein AGOR_G00077350 [Albula goreensis]